MKALLKAARTDGDERGSWDPQADRFGARGGRVFTTAALTLCLEVEDRYLRVIGAR